MKVDLFSWGGEDLTCEDSKGNFLQANISKVRILKRELKELHQIKVTPQECRTQLMKSLIYFIDGIDKKNLPDNSLGFWWLCRLLTGMVDEG